MYKLKLNQYFSLSPLIFLNIFGTMINNSLDQKAYEPEEIFGFYH